MALDFGKIAKGIIGTVAKVAPKVVSALPIPGVVGTIIEELGMEIAGKSEDDIIAEINAMPAEKLAILKTHDQKMRAFEVEERGQDLENVKHARERQKDLEFKSPHFVLGCLIVTVFLGVAVCVIFGVGPTLTGGERDMALLMIGYLAAGYKAVENFMYGSSLGSKKKTDALLNGKSGGNA